LLRNGVIDIETALGYSTNPGNLRLQLADYIEDSGEKSSEGVPAEVGIER
jgi:hypothetical protein